ncbi:hypothetical protein F5X97DRAFT_318520 [Nemania serpens]|nr:hypothetical protein F5X97DRAFT_318520 [Nemania serpens]
MKVIVVLAFLGLCAAAPLQGRHDDSSSPADVDDDVHTVAPTLEVGQGHSVPPISPSPKRLLPPYPYYPPRPPYPYPYPYYPPPFYPPPPPPY